MVLREGKMFLKPHSHSNCQTSPFRSSPPPYPPHKLSRSISISRCRIYYHISNSMQSLLSICLKRPSQILPISRIICPRFSRDAMFICDWGLEPRNLGDWWWAKSIADVPDGTNLSFHLSGMIADHRRNLGRVGKIETLPILPICPRPSETIGDIYDFEFSLVGKIWDSRETVKSPIVGDFPDIWKQGLIKQGNNSCELKLSKLPISVFNSLLFVFWWAIYLR